MKTKKTKEAVSLIVLVLTIVIMIILAGVIIINLNNSGIIDRAKNAVSETNLKNMQELANVAWGEAYLAIKGEKTPENLKSTMLEKLKGKGVSEEELAKYTFTVTTGGVEVEVNTGETTPEEPDTEENDQYTTLGELVTSALDYGKTIKYEANGVTDWKVFYRTDEYVYLITSYVLEPITSLEGTPNDKIRKDLWLANWIDYEIFENGSWVGDYLDEEVWADFKNETKYGNNVVAAIGTPTLEMFVESWNAKGEALNNTTDYGVISVRYDDEYGTCISINGVAGDDSIDTSLNVDSVYLSWYSEGSPTSGNGYNYFDFATPQSPDSSYTMCRSCDSILPASDGGCLCRPVVCLKAETPARLGTSEEEANFVLKEIQQ